ncbi:MAG: DNA mismatch repair endonuclease MutL [Rhodothermales bacterium]
MPRPDPMASLPDTPDEAGTSSAVPDESAPDGLIRVLPETLANKIAAGEVVQRPASALKELMENALDAGAGQVTVVLRQAGSELVQVVDDGCGMGPADAATCFGRHATSKITSTDDLERIRTLGFRGEALASISAVAHVELKSKRRGDAAGTCVRYEGGTCVAQTPCAAPDGTSVAVRNLFYNVPARRNFLKSPATEFKHLVETFQFLALSNPEVGFTLVHDDAEVYRLPPSEGGFDAALRRRIGDLMGTPDEALVSVAEATSYLSVRGFVGGPEQARKGRSDQYLFVNGRYIKNRSLDHAVAAAFDDLLPKGTFPLFALFLTLDPRHVDVNVHPTKTEVKFDDERGIYGFLRAVVKKALGDADVIPSLGDGFPSSRAEQSVVTASPADFRPVQFETTTHVEAGGSRSASPMPSDPTAIRSFERQRPLGDDFELEVESAKSIPSGPRPMEPEGIEDDFTPGDRPPVWQLHNRYVVTPIRSGLMLLDQRAAHERILYEQALAALNGGLASSQQLLFPVTLEFPPADFELLQELLPNLALLGFEITPFSGRTVKVEGVPADVQVGRERLILEEVLEQYKAYRDGLQLQDRDNLAKSLARRSAIKPGKALSDDEARSLIDQLFTCEMPYACPHGRPTMIKISMEELERRFNRG